MRFLGEQRGQSVTEFALVVPLFLLMIVGLLDLSRLAWHENTLAYAAREGTRYAIVHGSASDDPVHAENTAPIVAIVRNSAVGVRDVTVQVEWPDTSGGTPCYDRSCRVAVEATAPFVPFPSQLLFGGALSITLRAGSVLVIQR